MMNVATVLPAFPDEMLAKLGPDELVALLVSNIRTNAVDAVVAGANGQGRPVLGGALTRAAAIVSDEQEDWDFRLCVGNTLLDFPRAEYRPLLEDLAKRQSGWGVYFSMEDG